MDSLVLDIGGDVGALVIHAGPDLAEREIEISPAVPRDAKRSHNVVHARAGRHLTAYTAVFPSLPAGDYTVWALDGTRAAVITIRGGEVAEYHM